VSTETPPATVKPLDPAFDERAAEIMAAATGKGTAEAGRALIDNARGDAESAVFGLFVGEMLAAVYTLHAIPFMNELKGLAVAPEYRRQGHGRHCLYDALLRSGRKPLVVETDDDAVEFYKHCGFKIVGKRKLPNGVTRYRLGWHAPMPKAPGDESEGNCG
jgi:ribosomal protein S18 acetylase RimI-like enzyme